MATVAALGGCSFVMVRVPDARPTAERVDCRDAVVVPSLDAALTAAFGYGLVESRNVTQDYGAGFALVAFVGTELASTIYGFRALARCRRLNAGPA
jgi:hypothetical protein